MGEAPLILGVSGLRGIVGESLTPEVAVRYAGAFGVWLNDRTDNEKWPYVIVARDGREGGEAIYYAAISALIASGCRVCEIGVAMTPSVGVLCDAKRADGAVIITASHNPQEWNGLKLLVRRESWSGRTDGRANVIESYADACAPDAIAAGDIIKVFQDSSHTWDASAEYLSTTSDHDSEHSHCLRVLDACSDIAGVEYFWDVLENTPMRIVIDAVNCSGQYADRALFEDTPVHAVLLYGEPSGIFPHTPEPTKENLSGEGGLCDAVPGLKADVGFAQDPDADRLAIVDERGEYIGEEYTLVLAALSLLEARKTPSVACGDTSPAGAGEDQANAPVIVTNLSTSRMIDDVAARYGARVERTAVGEANVVERMKALKAAGEDVVLGGEGNGGVIWPEVVYVRDSLGAMALTLALMARTGKTVSELVSWINSMAVGGETGGTPVPPGYTIVKRKVNIPSKDAAKPAVEAVRTACEGEAGVVIDLQDGVRVDWPEQRAWAHVRASNTEPIMRLIGEAPSRAEAEALLARIEGMIAAG